MKTNKICIYLLVFIFIMSCVPIPPEDNHLNAIAINKETSPFIISSGESKTAVLILYWKVYNVKLILYIYILM